MAEISQLINASNDSDRYSVRTLGSVVANESDQRAPMRSQSIASTLMSTWTTLALSGSGSPSVLSTFGGQQNTWALPYNVYLQNMLGLALLNDTVCDRESSKKHTELTRYRRFSED